MNRNVELSHYIITSEVISILKKSLSKCNFLNLENGGDFCITVNEKGIPTERRILIENECIGNKCDIIHKGKCSEGKQIIGTFHNHPESIVADPSIRDFLTAYAYGLSCIGSVEKNSIICYERIGDFIEKNFRAILKADEKVGEILRYHEKLSDEKFLEYYEAEQDIVNTIKDKLFKLYLIFQGDI